MPIQFMLPFFLTQMACSRLLNRCLMAYFQTYFCNQEGQALKNVIITIERGPSLGSRSWFRLESQALAAYFDTMLSGIV